MQFSESRWRQIAGLYHRPETRCIMHGSPKNNALECTTTRHFWVKIREFLSGGAAPIHPRRGEGITLFTSHPIYSPNFKILLMSLSSENLSSNNNNYHDYYLLLLLLPTADAAAAVAAAFVYTICFLSAVWQSLDTAVEIDELTFFLHICVTIIA